jgi:hypothetical protein
MAEMSEKSARKYRDGNGLPSQQKKSPRNYRTRADPFVDVWGEIQARLEVEPSLKAKTLFEWLQSKYNDPATVSNDSQAVRFPDSVRRSFERRVNQWRSVHGPGKAVYFSQEHHPGRLAASDFTNCNELGVKIAGLRFDHLFYHCVLTFSNQESVSLCFSESFESLSTGIQKAFWEFGGVPLRHRSDSLAAAVRNHTTQRELTERYASLMEYYDCEAERTNPQCANENGDVESANHHLKSRIDQALLLRGSRNFDSREDYVRFVEELVAKANVGRRKNYLEETAHLRRLPDQRLDTDDIMNDIRVSASSTIVVRTNTYSVPSRLIGKQVDLRIGAESITVTHCGHVIQTMPRLVGRNLAAINYRHIVDSLLRKPGAFASYRYREEMFPTSSFRMAWDNLRAAHSEKVADRLYIELLHLAAYESQEAVADALRHLLATEVTLDVDAVRKLVAESTIIRPVTEVDVQDPVLSDFDCLHPSFNKECSNHDSGEIQEEVGRPECCEDAAFRSGQCALEPTEGTVSANDPQSVSGSSSAGDHRESQSSDVPVRTDDPGVRNTPTGANSAAADSFETASGKDMGELRFQTTAAAGDATTGVSSRGIVSEAERERADFWETGFREKSCSGGIVRAVDSARSQPAVYNVQPAGAAAADCETRPATAEDDSPAVGLRRSDH